jgi:hypothetical protein
LSFKTLRAVLKCHLKGNRANSKGTYSYTFGTVLKIRTSFLFSLFTLISISLQAAAFAQTIAHSKAKPVVHKPTVQLKKITHIRSTKPLLSGLILKTGTPFVA